VARRPIIEAAVDRILEDRPIVAAVVEGLRNAAGNPNNTLAERDIPVVAAAVQDAIARDPVAQNAMNAEPPSASRVVTGSVVAVVTGLGTLLTQLGPMLLALESGLNTGNKWATVVAFVFGGGSFGGGAFALFGRLKANLPPMTPKLWNPFSWFAPRSPR